MDGRTDGQKDGGDCITCRIDAVGNESMLIVTTTYDIVYELS